MANGAQCPVCLNDRIIPGVNDLATTHPEVAKEASGWDPTTVSFGSTKSRKWICSLGHQWMATCSSRTYMKSGCPFCAGARALKGFNDLATLRPDLASEADGWNPSLVTVRAGSKQRWRCSEGHRWVARVADRSGGRGCPTCAQTGYDPNQQGWLYLIEHTERTLLQVGLTNFPADRLGKHSRSGWEVLDLRGPMDGHLAQSLETSILRCLKRRGIAMANTLDIRRFDGWSEAWRSSDLVVRRIVELLNLVHEDEEKFQPNV